MSFYSMAKSLVGEVANTPLSLVQAKINEALGSIYDESDWSFQTIYGGFFCPGLLANTGTFTVTPFSNQVVADVVATAALASITGAPFITQLQYRDPSRSLYNIVAYDTTSNAPYATLTLDRIWMEPTQGPGQPYMIYQAYFPSPVASFRKFIEVRDTTNAGWIETDELSQADLARLDPQRTTFSDPDFIVPAGIDTRITPAINGAQPQPYDTYGNTMFELWPHQLSRVPYSFSLNYRGPLLSAPTDIVPYPLTEELVMWKAKEVLYQYKESQKGEDSERGRGANWQFLSQAASAQAKDRLEKIQAIDANLHTNFVNHVGRAARRSNMPFANRLGGLNVGGFPEQ